MAQQMPPVVMENVKIIFRNFAGNPDTFNPRGGKRTFNVVLPMEVAEAMARDGWNVKFPGPRDDGEERDPRIQVEASYNVRPPKVYLITSRGKTPLTESEIAMLDWAEITNVDLTLNPFAWGPNYEGKSGIKAYLGSIYVTILEDELDRKYADMHTAGAPPMEEDHR